MNNIIVPLKKYPRVIRLVSLFAVLAFSTESHASTKSTKGEAVGFIDKTSTEEKLHWTPPSAPLSPGESGAGFTGKLTPLFSICISYRMLQNTLWVGDFKYHVRQILECDLTCSDTLKDLVRALSHSYNTDSQSWSKEGWSLQVCNHRLAERIPALGILENEIRQARPSVFNIGIALMQFQAQLMSLAYISSDQMRRLSLDPSAYDVVRSSRLGVPHHFRGVLVRSLPAITHAIAFLYQQYLGLPLAEGSSMVDTLWKDFVDPKGYEWYDLNPRAINPFEDSRYLSHTRKNCEGVSYRNSHVCSLINANGSEAAWAFADSRWGKSQECQLIRAELEESLGRRWCAFRIRYCRGDDMERCGCMENGGIV